MLSARYLALCIMLYFALLLFYRAVEKYKMALGFWGEGLFTHASPFPLTYAVVDVTEKQEQ
jgi:hypothetical protein